MRSESNAIRSSSRSSTLRPATSTRCAPCPNRVSIWFFSYHSGGRMNLGSCSSPRRYSLDSGGRSYGGWGSWPISTTRPSKPSSRSVATAVPPAMLAPMTRKVGTGYSSATSNWPSSSRASNTSMGSVAGPFTTSPEVMSNWLPWQGHSITRPSRSPSASEQCWCVQTSSNACRLPPTFAMATIRSPTGTAVISPSPISPASTFTHSDIRWCSFPSRSMCGPKTRGPQHRTPTAEAGPSALVGRTPRPPPGNQVRGQVSQADHHVHAEQDEEPLPESERQHRGDQRAEHPRELEHHLVPNEHAAVRSSRRELLHEALEREATQLARGPGDQRERGEDRQGERDEREECSDPCGDDARHHHRFLSQRDGEPRCEHVAEEAAQGGPARQHREPVRRLAAAAKGEGDGEQQEPVRGPQSGAPDSGGGELRDGSKAAHLTPAHRHLRVREPEVQERGHRVDGRRAIERGGRPARLEQQDARRRGQRRP